MADYCIDCKYGGKTSGSNIHCDKHDRWMDKHGHCSDYIWVKARMILFEKGNTDIRQSDPSVFRSQIRANPCSSF